MFHIRTISLGHQQLRNIFAIEQQLLLLNKSNAGHGFISLYEAATSLRFCSCNCWSRFYQPITADSNSR